MKTLFIIISFITITATAQTVEQLEKELMNTVVSDLMAVRQKTNQIFKLDPYNSHAVYYLTECFKYNKYDDSIPILYDHLKKIDINNPKPFLLSARYQFKELTLLDTSKINELKAAYNLDNKHFETLNDLGVSYYNLFHQALTEKYFAEAKYYATSSKMYFLKALEVEPNSKSTLKYPVIQLSSYLHDNSTTKELKNFEQHPKPDNDNIPIEKQTAYYPLSQFMSLPTDWENNYELDLIHESGMALFVIHWYSKQIFALKEPIIYIQKNNTVYRFTWLRTFHNPIAIRIEKTNEKYMLFWKLANGAGGYSPRELITDKSKEISKEQWDKFIALIEKANFWTLPTQEKGVNGNDGSQWIIESSENGKYHCVDRWTPSKNSFQKCGSYLINLTDLKINDKDKY